MSSRFCHAVTSTPPSEEGRLDIPYTCSGKPIDYEGKWLWLRRDLTANETSWDNWSLNVHQTRFRQLIVTFHHADGTRRSHAVKAGDFGTHWTPNAYIEFSADPLPTPVTAITVGIERLATFDLLRIRLVQRAEQQRAAQFTAILVGASLSLLCGSLIYNLFLAFGLRQTITLWHAAWVACMIAWGMFWSQLALAILPSFAGIPAVRACALLAAGALAFATRFLLASLGRENLPKWLYLAVTTLAWLVMPAAVVAAFAPPGAGTVSASIYSVIVLALLGFAIFTLGLAAWRRNPMARDFILAWGLPIFSVIASQRISKADLLPVISGELLVLGTSALQTVWLSIAFSRRFAALQAERDQARARQIELKTLAETDPLTKVLNRRGLTERLETALAASRASNRYAGLMLVDIDHFKSINDTFGHDVGDIVLQRVGELLGRLTQEGAVVGRLGGEEFCIFFADRCGRTLQALAERVRCMIAEADLSTVFSQADRRITASFGIVDTRQFRQADLSILLRAADQALYRAKALGRNRVVAAWDEAPAAENSLAD